MDGHAPVVVHPWLDGSRRVTIRGEHVGKAYRLSDVIEFLRRAGLEAPDLEDPAFIEWRGGDSGTWE